MKVLNIALLVVSVAGAIIELIDGNYAAMWWAIATGLTVIRLMIGRIQYES